MNVLNFGSLHRDTSPEQCHPGQDFCISDFGACGDASTLNTECIQNAIDTCSAAGGGRVIVPPGVFLSGTLWLRSHVELHLASPCSVLKASPRHEDYNRPDAFEQNWTCDNEQMNGSHFIIGVEVEGISITGPGVIDGNGDSFFKQGELFFPKDENYCYWPHGYSIVSDPVKMRPGQMILLCECVNVRIQDVFLRNSPYWTCCLHGCRNARIRGVQIWNPPFALNSDGIDIDCSSNVCVSDCIIETGDDALTLRGDCVKLKNSSAACENIMVNNCILTSGGANAIRIGVGNGIIRNAVFSNLLFRNSVGGVHIQSKYAPGAGAGTSISNIQFCNVLGSGIQIPLFINSGFDASARIRNIVFQGIRSDMRHTAAFIGNAFTTLENIAFSDVEFTVNGRTSGTNSHCPDCSEYSPHFGSLDCAVYFAFAKEVSLDGFQLRWNTREPGWKYGIACADSADIHITGNSKTEIFQN